MLRALALAAVLCGCATDEQESAPEARSQAACVEAVDLYYAAGCAYSVSGSVPVPHDAMARVCEVVSERLDCAGAVEALLTCSRRAGAPTCGCEAKLGAALWCR